MLKSKDALISLLENLSEQIVFDNEICEQIRNYMFEKYDIPIGTTMDMIAISMLAEKTEFILFCLVDGIDTVLGSDHKEEFFSEIEINSYKTMKAVNEKIEFPIRIPCFAVTEDQWIGATSSKFFMDLRREQLIKYNANAQRIMKKIIKGESIIFKMLPNKLAIKAIKILMLGGLFIPNTITLNIPYDSDADFYYDNGEKELVIKSISNFDISDGYHRYLAMAEISDIDPNFNYPMEIRIINFTEEKTRQFIFQEDQKTKMTKTESNTMNINRASNNVIDRLNEMSSFDFKGQIGRNDGTINFAAMSDFVEYFYFRAKKQYTNLDIRNVANTIKGQFNALSEYDPSYITKPLGFRELAVIFHVFSVEEDLSKAVETIDTALKSGVINSSNVRQGKITKTLFKTISSLL